MASIFHSTSTKSKKNGLAASMEPIENQVEQIREDIATLTRILAEQSSRGADTARETAREARDRAEVKLGELVRTGEDLMADLRARYGDTGQRITQTAREHPVATVATAAAVGLVIAALLRR